MTSLAEPIQVIDVRAVPPVQRHPLIFSAFDGLAPDQALELINDHDPVPLHGQFEKNRPGQFRWDYLEAGPTLWRLRITSMPVPAGQPAAGSDCCGGCSCR